MNNKCIKDTQLVGKLLEEDGNDKQIIKACKRAIKKIRDEDFEEEAPAIKFLKDNGCDLDKIKGSNFKGSLF